MLLEMHIMMLVCVGAQLTSANQGLLAVGVILLSVGIVLGVIISSMVFKKGTRHSYSIYVLIDFLSLVLSPLGPWLSLGLSVTGFVVAFLSLVLWLAVGFHVGLHYSLRPQPIINSFVCMCMQIHVILLGSLLEMVS